LQKALFGLAMVLVFLFFGVSGDHSFWECLGDFLEIEMMFLGTVGFGISLSRL
jgi:hypothetical protein